MTTLSSAASSVVLAVAVLYGAPAAARVAATPVQPRSQAGAAAAPPVHDSAPHKRARCDACGVIQGIRRVDAAEGLPPTYEITIRLHDGSMRTSSNATPGNWRAGDRIMLINRRRPAIVPNY